jgi:hypothetical protein
MADVHDTDDGERTPTSFGLSGHLPTCVRTAPSSLSLAPRTAAAAAAAAAFCGQARATRKRTYGVATFMVQKWDAALGKPSVGAKCTAFVLWHGNDRGHAELRRVSEQEHERATMRRSWVMSGRPRFTA